MSQAKSLSEVSRDVERQVTEELAEELVRGGSGQLNLTGLEVVAFIASKVVLPIVCSFTGKLLYDKWKAFRTRKDAEEARKALDAAAPAAQDARPARDEVVSGATQALVGEGLAEDKAKAIAEGAYDKVERSASETPNAGGASSP